MNLVATVISIMIILFGFAGGGGSDSDGGGSYSSFDSSSSYSGSGGSSGDLDGGIGVAIIGCAWSVMGIMIIFVALDYKKYHKDHASTPREKEIHTQAEEIFKSYQRDWSEFNYDNIKNYTTERYYGHVVLMLDLLREMHRVNKVSEIKIHRIALTDSVPDDAIFPMRLHIVYYFSGLDQVFDSTSNEELYKYQARMTYETWNYVYDGEKLLLDSITQPTESPRHLAQALEKFALDNGMYYSPDWGRYCLPRRGLIFGGVTMRYADVNNHIIGRWGNGTGAGCDDSGKNTDDQSTINTANQSALQTSDNRGGLLVQLYTYVGSSGQSLSSYYLVGQINVPKKYLGVIVKSRQFKTKRKPDKSYQKFALEWPDFNKRYEVYAASRDALPAFELLDPTFMEFLYSKNPAYNLEVADDVIYIYTENRKVKEQDYVDMIEVLREAYKRLRM